MRKIMLLTVLLGLVVFIKPIYVQAQPPGGTPPGQGGLVGDLQDQLDAEEAARIADVNAEEVLRQDGWVLYSIPLGF